VLIVKRQEWLDKVEKMKRQALEKELINVKTNIKFLANEGSFLSVNSDQYEVDTAEELVKGAKEYLKLARKM